MSKSVLPINISSCIYLSINFFNNLYKSLFISPLVQFSKLCDGDSTNLNKLLNLSSKFTLCACRSVSCAAIYISSDVITVIILLLISFAN